MVGPKPSFLEGPNLAKPYACIHSYKGSAEYREVPNGSLVFQHIFPSVSIVEKSPPAQNSQFNRTLILSFYKSTSALETPQRLELHGRKNKDLEWVIGYDVE